MEEVRRIPKEHFCPDYSNNITVRDETKMLTILFAVGNQTKTGICYTDDVEIAKIKLFLQYPSASILQIYKGNLCPESKIIIGGQKMYKIETATRIQEGASWEDIENGDAYETAYIVTDENGEIVHDTTDREIAMSYLEV